MLHSVSLDSSPTQDTSLTRIGWFGFLNLDGSRAIAPVHVEVVEISMWECILIHLCMCTLSNMTFFFYFMLAHSVCSPSFGNPSWPQVTCASFSLHPETETSPQTLLKQISNVPFDLLPPDSLMSPSLHAGIKVYEYHHYHVMSHHHQTALSLLNPQ